MENLNSYRTFLCYPGSHYAQQNHIAAHTVMFATFALTRATIPITYTRNRITLPQSIMPFLRIRYNPRRIRYRRRNKWPGIIQWETYCGNCSTPDRCRSLIMFIDYIWRTLISSRPECCCSLAIVIAVCDCYLPKSFYIISSRRNVMHAPSIACIVRRSIWSVQCCIHALRLLRVCVLAERFNAIIQYSQSY